MIISRAPTPEDRIRQRTYWISFIVSVLLMGIKFAAYEITKSQGVFSDALESIINVITPMVGLLALRAAAKPADAEHPYGHGKVEYFSSAFEGGLILFAAVMIIAKAVTSAYDGHEIGSLDTGIVFVFAAAVVNLVLGYYVLGVGEKHHSPALRANGKHILSDVWTTGGVLVGLFAVKVTGLVWLDIAAALVVGALLAFDGLRVVWQSAGGLMDAEDRDLTQSVADLFTQHRQTGVIHIHHTRVMRSGRFHHIDSHVVLPEYWNIEKAHEEMQRYENAVIQDYKVDGEVHFHLDPCRKAYCEVCDDLECPIRLKPFKSLIPITVDSLTNPLEPEEYR